ncbi:MAG TPA: glycosyltransferase family 4 protein [Chloroflexota bacterium]|nr:glycosyltransferase family 4 protein [Chloroflexota bacterium]
MRILLLSSHFPPEKGSASRLFFELAESLSERGHDVTVLTGFPRYLMWSTRQNGLLRQERQGLVRVVRVFNFPLSGWGPYRRGMDQLFMAMAQFVGAAVVERPDVILMYSPPLPPALAAWALSRLWRIPYAVNVQDLFPRSAVDLELMSGRRITAAFEAVESFVYRTAGALAVISEGNRNHVVGRGADPKNVEIISNWADIELVRPGPPNPGLRDRLGLRPVFTVQYSGVMGYSQDLDTVIEAAVLLQQEDGILFHLSGDGVERDRLEHHAAAYQLTNIAFTGLQPQERYGDVLRLASAGLVTLRPEVRSPSVPSKLFNIMASGRPVVLSLDAGGDARRIVEKYRCGVAVPPGNPVALSEAILDLYRHPQAAEEMGRNGRVAVERHFSREHAVDAYEGLLRRLTEAKPGVAGRLRR